MDAVTAPAVKQVTVMKSARVGYALALDTPLPTPSGWTTMGEVCEGSLLLDENGKPCRVMYMSPVYTDHQCYRITFCDDSTVVADAGHRWYVEADQSFEYLRGERGAGRVGRPKPGEVSTKAGVVSTEEMFRMARTSRGRTALAVPVAQPLDLPEVELPMPPYALGLWLGDGHAVSPRITQHFEDVETAEYIEEEGIRVSIGPDGEWPNNRSYLLDTVPGKWSPWARVMRQLGVLSPQGVKHVPPAYLRAGRHQRLAILQGLMDSDGTISPKGFAEFACTVEPLSRGVYELVTSLGMKASWAVREPQRENCLPQYRVVFKPTPDCNPFRLRRKAARVAEAAKVGITKRRRIVSIEPVETVPVKCVGVDSLSRLFLCGRGMIPTHNTKVLDHVVGYFIHQDPSPILVVQPRVEDAEDYSRSEIAPMLRDTPVLAEIAGDLKAKDANQRILKRAFRNGASVSFVGANSPGGFRRITARIVAFDEVDGYPPAGAGDEGDQITLGTKRTESFWNRKIILGSTPTVKGVSRIEKAWAESDQRRYHVSCPTCGHCQVLRWANLRWEKVTADGEVVVDVPDGISIVEHRPETAHFVCEAQNCRIEEHHKPAMIAGGEWVAERPFNGHAGFHIWAAYSLFPNAAWRFLVEEFLRVRKDPTLLQTFVNLVLGESWEEQAETLAGHALSARGEAYDPLTLPEGVRVLTAGVDTQGDRLEVQVIGWGAKEESWPCLYEVIRGDPAQPEVWKQLDALLLETFRTEGGRNLRVRACCADTGGHHAERVYAFASARKLRNIYAIKGIAGPKPIWPRKASRAIGNNQVFIVGVDTAKDAIYARLRIPKPGPGFVHFPADDAFGDEYFEQLTVEKVVTRYRMGQPVRVWDKPKGARNEALDTFVYALAALKSLPMRLDKMEPISTDVAADMPADHVPLPPPVAARPRAVRPMAVANDPYL